MRRSHARMTSNQKKKRMDQTLVLPQSWTGPGLIDLQVNGYAGFDFKTPAEEWTLENLRHVRRAAARRGVLAIFPTLTTGDGEAMVARARKYAELLARDPSVEAAFPKLHIEGPFISGDDGPRGAHRRKWRRDPRDAPDLLARLQAASGGRVGILTLAPELPGAMELIREAAAQGICVAIGHTGASAEIIAAAVEAGARMSTHLGNGSHQMLPRLDNYVQAQLADDRLAASFIADGHHIPFFTLKNFLRAKTAARSILVTDAIAAAEVGPGKYVLGGEDVIVTEALRCYKPGQPNLAGSALTLDRAVINACVHCGVPFEEAWAMASAIPASLLGLASVPSVSVRVHSDHFENRAPVD